MERPQLLEEIGCALLLADSDQLYTVYETLFGIDPDSRVSSCEPDRGTRGEDRLDSDPFDGGPDEAYPGEVTP